MYSTGVNNCECSVGIVHLYRPVTKTHGHFPLKNILARDDLRAFFEANCNYMKDLVSDSADVEQPFSEVFSFKFK